MFKSYAERINFKPKILYDVKKYQMKRRDFIQKTAASSALLALPSLPLMSFTKPEIKKITIGGVVKLSDKLEIEL